MALDTGYNTQNKHIYLRVYPLINRTLTFKQHLVDEATLRNAKSCCENNIWQHAEAERNPRLVTAQVRRPAWSNIGQHGALLHNRGREGTKNKERILPRVKFSQLHICLCINWRALPFLDGVHYL